MSTCVRTVSDTTQLGTLQLVHVVELQTFKASIQEALKLATQVVESIGAWLSKCDFHLCGN